MHALFHNLYFELNNYIYLKSMKIQIHFDNLKSKAAVRQSCFEWAVATQLKVLIWFDFVYIKKVIFQK